MKVTPERVYLRSDVEMLVAASDSRKPLGLASSIVTATTFRVKSFFGRARSGQPAACARRETFPATVGIRATAGALGADG